jgi:hypothetical protein
VNHCHGPGRGHPCTGGAGAAVTLPDAPDRYFARDAKTHMVPISRVETIRARPEGIANAEPHMRRAYDGTGGKRGPVTLTPKPGGGFTVLDGNSTVAIARKHGWQKIPAHILTTPGELAAFHAAEAEKKAAKAARKAAA